MCNYVNKTQLWQVLVDRTQHPSFLHRTPLFFYFFLFSISIFFSFPFPWKWRKKMKKGGVGCKKGRCCVLSTGTCDNYKTNVALKWDSRCGITLQLITLSQTEQTLILQEIPRCCVSNIKLTCGNILKWLMITHVNVIRGKRFKSIGHVVRLHT